MFIIKRNGKQEKFKKEKIINAITKAFNDVEGAENNLDLCIEISKKIEEEIKHYEDIMGIPFTIEQIQDMVESELIKANESAVVKAFILYRDKHRKIREEWRPYKPFKYLSNEFLRNYASNPNPFETQISKFTFYRTYSRFIEKIGRRETWLEMNARVVDYIISLDPQGTVEKAEELFKDMFNFNSFASGRIRYIGGTASIEKNFQSAFNCSFITMDDIFNLTDAMYLLMLGSGVGYRILKEDVEKIQPIRQNIEVIHKDYTPVNPKDRQELTTTNLKNNTIMEIVVGDSKRGWVNALRIYLEFLTNYKKSSNDDFVKTLLFNYDNVRPKGERLKTFGGTASGYIPLKNSFSGIDRVIKGSKGSSLSRSRVKLKPIDILDINGLIAEAIVVGGVRRAAEIALISSDDYEVRNAKTNLYIQKNGKWLIDTKIKHRQMSNNTIMYQEKPTREVLHEHVQTMKISGEPGISNLEEMKRRKPEAEGLNPLTN